MKIGIYNIFTMFWFLLMLVGGGSIIYVALPKLLDSELIFIAKFFIVVLALVILGVIFFLFIKFQVLVITKTKIISLYPFKFKYTLINKKNVNSIKWFNWEFKGILYKSLEIKASGKDEIEFSDFEFHNFNQLEVAFSDNIQSNQQRLKVILEQAVNNFKLAVFSALVYLVAFMVILGFSISHKSLHWFSFVFIVIGLIFSYIETKKAFKYKRIKTTLYNKV